MWQPTIPDKVHICPVCEKELSSGPAPFGGPALCDSCAGGRIRFAPIPDGVYTFRTSDGAEDEDAGYIARAISLAAQAGADQARAKEQKKQGRLRSAAVFWMLLSVALTIALLYGWVR